MGRLGQRVVWCSNRRITSRLDGRILLGLMSHPLRVRGLKDMMFKPEEGEKYYLEQRREDLKHGMTWISAIFATGAMTAFRNRIRTIREAPIICL